MRNKDYQFLLRKKNCKNAKICPLAKPKKYKYLYSKMLKKETILAAWKSLRKGKTKRREVIQIEKDLESNAERMREMIYNTRPDAENPERGYHPPKKRRTKRVNERGKERTAYIADIWEQWYFHVIVKVLQPIVMRRLHGQCHGSVPGRGPHKGKRHIEKLIREGRAVRNFLKFDIRHFYDSLQISVVIGKLREEIEDELFIHCVSLIYRGIKKGIMIGLYVSPWLANYALVSMDEAIIKHGGVDEIRYMDDVVVFSGSKRKLRSVLETTKKSASALRLKIKRNYAVAKFDYVPKRGERRPRRIGRPLDFMGFVFYRDRTRMRKHIMLRCCRMARGFAARREKGQRIRGRDAKAFISLMGWFKHTDSYDCYLDRIKPLVNIRRIKRMIAKQDSRAALAA